MDSQETLVPEPPMRGSLAEIEADDYRMLFGVGQGHLAAADHMNRNIPDPRQMQGLGPDEGLGRPPLQ